MLINFLQKCIRLIWKKIPFCTSLTWISTNFDILISKILSYFFNFDFWRHLIDFFYLVCCNKNISGVNFFLKLCRVPTYVISAFCVSQISFTSNQEYRSVWAKMVNLWNPSNFHIFKTRRWSDVIANNDDVSLIVGKRSQTIVVFLSGCVEQHQNKFLAVQMNFCGVVFKHRWGVILEWKKSPKLYINFSFKPLSKRKQNVFLSALSFGDM